MADKELLLEEICARLPYGTMYETPFGARYLRDIHIYPDGTAYINHSIGEYNQIYGDEISTVKMYLRPMSSMIEDEKKEYALFYRAFSCSLYERESVERADWLNKHHFDYRGLIEKGLALEAPEGMYD